MKHLIHRQCWQIKAHTQEAAFAIRQQLRAQLDSALLPVFEHAFDALGGQDEVIHIPHLALDLKLQPGDDFLTALADELRDKLGSVLQSALITPPEQSGVKRYTVPVTRRKRLLNYLATGQLEWHDYAEDADKLVLMLQTEAAIFSKEHNALNETGRGSLTQRIAASFRLLQLLPVAQRTTLLSRVSLSQASLSPVSPATALPDSLSITPAVLLIVLRQLIASGILPGRLQLRVQAMLLAVHQEDLTSPLPADILTLLEECHVHLTPHASATPLSAALTQLIHAGTAHLTAQHAPSLKAPTRSSAIEHVTPMRTTDTAPGAAIPANAAGLILLHPFLPRLFDATGIAPTGIAPAGTLSEDSLPRAAAMLHWLACGREEIYEFELTTIKVLLGMTPEQTLLVSGGLLSAADRIEGDSLLAAAISHWGALGTISLDGLRGAFLQRRGLLREMDSGWQLQVESEPFDLLLGRLPWSISIVRLPWMSKAIFTEWPMP